MKSTFDSEIPGYAGGSYTCPPFDYAESHKIAWLQRSVATGLEWLQSQAGGQDVEATVDLIVGRVQESFSQKLSRFQVKRLKRDLREVISTLTNLNPQANYTAAPEELQGQVKIFNKRQEYWWQTSFVDRALKKALQHGVCGAGYISLVWGKSPYGSEQNDVIPKVLGTFEFIPDQIARDHNPQTAYAGHILDAMPYNLARATFYGAAPFLVPDRTLQPSTGANQRRTLPRWAGTLMNAIGWGGALQSTMTPLNSFPEVDVYYTYVADDSINTSGREMHVDEVITSTEPNLRSSKGSTWEYTIPYEGQSIPTGRMIQAQDPMDPQADSWGMIPETRPATREEARIYPLRRLVIWTSHKVIYDGPSFWWHGKIPVVKLSLEQWPWEYLGVNLVKDNISIERSINSIMRAVVDTLELSLNPPVKFKEKEHSKAQMEQLNLRIPGQKIRASGLIPNSIEPVLPYQHYQIQQAALPIVQTMKQDLDYQIGVQDLTSVAKLQQVPSAETVEKLLQAAGPLVQDYAREMERFLTELAMLFMWLVLQFDTMRRRLEILGANGLVKEDFDFDPAKLSPAEAPGVPFDAPVMRKGIAHGRRFGYSIVPRSVFRVTDVQNKLFYFQLWRDGRFPISPWKLAKVWDIDNFGEAPHETEIENWEAWMERQTKFQTLLQIQSQVLMAQAQMAMAKAMMLQGGAPQGPQGPGAGGPEGAAGEGGNEGGEPPTGKREGRPPSGNEPPKLETKGDGRSTVSES
jgi:hypothetical protein